MRTQIPRKLATAAALLVAALATVLMAFASVATATASNPDFRPTCGTKVILVLDESGSLTSASEVQAVRDAANGFATGLADTGSQLAVVEFGSSATRVFGYTNVTSGAAGTLATSFQPYFNGTAPGDRYDPPSQNGHWTNWDDALEEVRLINQQFGAAPLVVFITDGDPTAFNRDKPGEPGDVLTDQAGNPETLIRAVEEADAIKAQGSHILAVGVGAALQDQSSLNRLKEITGPDVAESAAALNLSSTDVLRIADFASLPNAVRQVAVQLCGSAPAVTPPAVIAGTPGTTLAIDKRGPARARAGQLITYSVTVGNSGTVTAQDVIVRDRIPSSMFVARRVPGVSVVKGQLLVRVGTLAPGQSRRVTFVLRIDRRAFGARTNVATASASNAATVRDSVRTTIARIPRPVLIPRVTG